MYTVDYFINKFEAIPEDNWLIREFMDDKGSCCVMGHCDYTYNNGLTERGCLEELFKQGLHAYVPNSFNSCYYVEQAINNGDHPDYKQPTPKQRILSALYDIKKMQEREEGKTKPTNPYEKDLTKELAVLPVDKKETDVESKIVLNQTMN